MPQQSSGLLSRTWTRLIAASQAEAEHLWGELFEHYRARLLVRIRYRLKSTAGVSLSAEDVLQDVYLRAFEIRERLKDPAGRGPIKWLNAISDRVLIEIVKRESRRLVSSVEDDAIPARTRTPSRK